MVLSQRVNRPPARRKRGAAKVNQNRRAPRVWGEHSCLPVRGKQECSPHGRPCLVVLCENRTPLTVAALSASAYNGRKTGNDRDVDSNLGVLRTRPPPTPGQVGPRSHSNWDEVLSTTVRCPHCQANLKLPSEALGKKLRCPRCQK